MSTGTEPDSLEVDHDHDSDGRGRPPIPYMVDGEHYTTTDRTLTPRQIMTRAGVDPDHNYLVEVKGRHQTSYKDRPNDEIRVQKDDTFITVSTDPTPVS